MESHDPKYLIHFFNRLIYPLVNLSGEKSVDEFFKLESEHVEKTKFLGDLGSSTSLKIYDDYLSKPYKTRVIVFAYDRSDYDEEISKIKEAARTQAKREDFRMAICSDKKLIKKLKESTSWF